MLWTMMLGQICRRSGRGGGGLTCIVVPQMWILMMMILSLLLILHPQPVVNVRYNIFRWLFPKALRGCARLCSHLRLNRTDTQAPHLARMWFTHLVLSDPPYYGVTDLETRLMVQWHEQMLKPVNCHLNRLLVRRLDREADPHLLARYVQHHREHIRVPPNQTWFSWPLPMLAHAHMEACQELKDYVYWQGIPNRELNPFFLPDEKDDLWYYDWRVARRLLLQHFKERIAAGATGSGVRPGSLPNSYYKYRRRRKKRSKSSSSKSSKRNEKRKPTPKPAIGPEYSEDEDEGEEEQQAKAPYKHHPSTILRRSELKPDQVGEILLMQTLLCPLKADYRLSAEYVRSQVDGWRAWTRNPLMEGSLEPVQRQTILVNLWAILSSSDYFRRVLRPDERAMLYTHLLLNVFDYRPAKQSTTFDTPVGNGQFSTSLTQTVPPPLVELPREYLYFATFRMARVEGRGFEVAEFHAVLEHFIRAELVHISAKCFFSDVDCFRARFFDPVDKNKAQVEGGQRLTDYTVRYLNRWTELLLTVCPVMRAIVRNFDEQELVSLFRPPSDEALPGLNYPVEIGAASSKKKLPNDKTKQRPKKPKKPSAAQSHSKPDYRDYDDYYGQHGDHHSKKNEPDDQLEDYYISDDEDEGGDEGEDEGEDENEDPNPNGAANDAHQKDDSNKFKRSNETTIRRQLEQQLWWARCFGACSRNPKKSIGGLSGLGLLGLLAWYLGGGGGETTPTSAVTPTKSQPDNEKDPAAGLPNPPGLANTDPATKLAFYTGALYVLGFLVLLGVLYAMWRTYCCSSGKDKEKRRRGRRHSTNKDKHHNVKRESKPILMTSSSGSSAAAYFSGGGGSMSNAARVIVVPLARPRTSISMMPSSRPPGAPVQNLKTPQQRKAVR